MDNTATQAKAITKSEDATLDMELSKVGITTLFTVGGLIGLWAIACMVSGLLHSGGPFVFLQKWFGAVIGM